MDRRKFLASAAAGAVVSSSASALLARFARASTVPPGRTVARSHASTDVLAQTYPFVLPALGYDHAAVEPAVDAETMSLHHDKHHAAYVSSLNEAMASHPSLRDTTLRELLSSLDQVPNEARDAIRNNGGGHANHAMFWELLAPGGAAQPGGALRDAIARDFGSVPACLSALKDAGAARFGSGWIWLVRDTAGVLSVQSTPNQDTPLMRGERPVLGVDVWEHAYYLKYRNRRPEYLDAVLARLNWDAAARAYGD